MNGLQNLIIGVVLAEFLSKFISIIVIKTC